MLKIFYKRRYETPETLYEGLRNEEDAAVQKLIDLIAPHAMKLGRINHLTDNQIDEVVLKSVMRHLECLREGSYVYQESSCPSVFTRGILHNRIRDFWRKPRATEALDKAAQVTVSDASSQLEAQDLLSRGLALLTEAEQLLLLHTYQAGYKDGELLLLDTVNQSNAPALRTARKRARQRFVRFAQLMTLAMVVLWI
jgi:DNA-directed RNA polymerase specialized sigma24 family protein